MATRETQRRIIQAAIQLFNKHGTAAVSANRIAEECGISKGNLHYHFRTKLEIIQTIFQLIVEEMNDSWYRDLQQPTIQHLAEMFSRQVLLAWEYRFFYREMPALLRKDDLLMRRYRDNRLRRTRVLEDFFMELNDRGELRFDGDRKLIHSIVESTWIISDNWLNSREFLGQGLDEPSIVAGYRLILDILRPYLAGDEKRVVDESRLAIHRYLKREGIEA
jgi:AcrR family transcriptional regulator